MTPNPADRRPQRTALADEGARRLALAEPALEQCERKIKAPFAPDPRAALREHLREIADAASCI